MPGDKKLVWIAVLVFFTILLLGSLLVYTFGVLCVGAFFLLWLRAARKKPVWTPSDRAEGALILLSVLWFALNLVAELFRVSWGREVWQFDSAGFALAFLFPPLIMHVFYGERKRSLERGRGWQWSLRLAYWLSLPTSVLVGARTLGWFSAYPVYTLASVLLPALFIFASVFSVLALLKARRPEESADERGARKWSIVLFVLLAGFFLFFLATWTSGTSYYQQFREVIGLLSRSMPLLFIFVSTYYGARFEFFDVFVKRGTFFFLTLIVLTAYFSVTTPWLDQAGVSWVKPWIYAVTLLPLVFGINWGFRRLEEWLDRSWLGRRFSTVEAVKFFLSGVEQATTVEQLVLQSRRRLSEIFQAEVSILLTSRSPLPEDSTSCCGAVEPPVELPILSRGEQVGLIRMGPRPNKTPYFSEDSTLLASLGEIFSSLLENLRLQEEKQQQEKREQELILYASRSELKALRAQINPHFLFNALNAIAGLVHKDPQRAEETVEQLAEVFRYTLTRSEKEWVRIDEEMDFVRSYLEVEKARFGPRLSVEIHQEDEVADVEIPSMMVQTLVENAVKHGISALREGGKLSIRAECKKGMVWIQVADNGPGFRSQQGSTSWSASTGTGYGLQNIRRRLEGYFGDRAQLGLYRDEAAGLTVLTLGMPLSRHDAGQVKTS